jgi:hypothetical protein
MTGTIRKPEVDERMVKLLVGAIAFALPILVGWTAWPVRLGSISAAYWEPFWPQTIFIGFLFAIAAYLWAYDGRTNHERVAAKIAAAAAMLIAMFPCNCTRHDEIIDGVHYASAILMYLVLAYFCWQFRARALAKGWARARARAKIYTGCAAVLAVAIVLLAANYLTHNGFTNRWETFVFTWESIGLFAFGFSWLTASHALPWLNHDQERFHPLAAKYSPPVEANEPDLGATRLP